MAYDRRQKLLAAAKRQMKDNDVDYTPPRKEWDHSSSDSGFVKGQRSDHKTQRNLRNRVARGLTQQIRNETVTARDERQADIQGRNWQPMPAGTLVQFIRNTRPLTSTGSVTVEKNTVATVVREFESEGKRYVEVLVGAQIATVSKGSITEL